MQSIHPAKRARFGDAGPPPMNTPPPSNQPTGRRMVPPQGGAPPPRPGMGPPGRPVPVISEEDEAIRGDEIDVLSARDIAIMRYVRNHEWMSEVLGSAQTTRSIISPSLGTEIFAPEGEDPVKYLQEKIAKEKEEIEKLSAEIIDTTPNTAIGTVYQEAYNALSAPSADCDAISAEVEAKAHIKIVARPRVVKTPWKLTEEEAAAQTTAGPGLAPETAATQENGDVTMGMQMDEPSGLSDIVLDSLPEADFAQDGASGEQAEESLTFGI
ncbi:hypothetical protein CANCADRAFT_133273 [Tortispora caseinolytica NRRL Y-17796]|uniref:SWI/SNF and RSC complexes subunit Ssr4 C-terminal domain-containing protein n=1 Tax=Tortispora caseinolytica NRRL Y-17796 TaxID=767744 RepID=A0A1E4TBB4_9ASCO|nr:hypothetical protein CANCADRAFT_133273 [Tortispora caseinolytica NRRL Y-17796]